jgi:hypothetical protein
LHRLAEIPADGAGDEPEVLLGQRPVEAEVTADQLHRLRIDGLAEEHQLDRIAGNDQAQGKDDDRDTEQRWNHQQQTRRGVATHSRHPYRH